MLTLALPALAFLATGLLVLLFYFLRMRFRRQPVSSTYLWQRLIQTNEGGARLKRRALLLLVLQLLAVVALVLALAHLAWAYTTPVKAGTVYLLDTSASMGAQEPDQVGTRFDRARRAILDAYRAGPASQPVAVFAGDRTFEHPQGEGLEAFLASVTVGDGAFTEAPLADTLGAWLQTHPSPWTGVLVSDGGLDQGGRRLAATFDRWRALDWAREAPNLGVIDLRVGRDQVGITVFNGFSEAQTTTLALTLDGAEVLRGDETVPPGTSVVNWTLPEPRGEPGLWKVNLPDHRDALAADDAFEVAIGPVRRARVLHLGSDPFVRAAFPGADYQQRPGGGTEGGPWDVVVAEQELPAGWEGNLVTFGVLPPGAPAFWGPGVTGGLSGEASVHALSRWVPWTNVVTSAGRGLVAQPGATVLAEAGGWPVVVTWDQPEGRVLALGIDTGNSNLGLTPVLPVLLHNFRQASVPQEGNPQASQLRVGQTTRWAGGKGWKVTSSTPAGATLVAVRRGGLWELTPQHRGTFTWSDGAESGVMTAHLPATESDTSPRAGAAKGNTGPQGELSQTSQSLPLAFLLILLAVALLVAEWRLWNGRFHPRANPRLALFRGVTLAAALLALAGLTLPWPTADRNLTLLFDVSASQGPELVERQRQAALGLVDRLAPTDRVALVAFASQAHVLSGLQPRDQARRALEEAGLSFPEDQDGTNLAAALTAGASLLAGESGSSSQLVFTDGRGTVGGDLDSLGALARRFPVAAVPLGRSLAGVAGAGLELPAGVRPGEVTGIRWRGWSDEARSVTLELSVDGRPEASKKAQWRAGAQTETFLWQAGQPGTVRFDVAVQDSQGRRLPSAQASGLLEVEGRASVLVIRGPGSSPALVQALEKQNLPVVSRGPDGLPADAAGYQSVSAVILDNVPAPALTAPQQGQLRDWVASGGGLLVVGGTESLGRGEYFDSPLEDLLPVHTDQRQRLQFTRSRLLFVVDHSGSMSEEIGGTTKLQAALGGVASSLDQLTIQDEVGILQFDTQASWVLPFTPLTEKEAIVASLGKFFEGGGTDMTKALDEVIRAFGRPGPVKRHVILLTDGQTGEDEGFYREFAETMKAAQVSLTVLGIGSLVNDKLLGTLATASDGVYYHAQGADIPSLLHKETVRVTRDLVQEGRFTPTALGHDPKLDLGTPPPPVLGYLVTRSKPLARVRWQVDRPGGQDPLFADWRFGSGHVAVFTSDSGKRWMTPWSGRPEYNRFWGQVVRSLEAPTTDKTLGLEVSVSASMAKVVVEAVDDAGRLRTGAVLWADLDGQRYPLTERAPGRYEASLPLTQTGLQSLTVGDATGTGRASTWAWNPPGAEGSRGGIDWAALARLTSGTGGLLQPLEAVAPPAPAWAWAPVALRDWLLGLALLLFLVELGWRSTSLGQWNSARALFTRWWADQKRPWVPRAPQVAVRDDAETERRTREAYRALAQRHQRRG